MNDCIKLCILIPFTIICLGMIVLFGSWIGEYSIDMDEKHKEHDGYKNVICRTIDCEIKGYEVWYPKLTKLKYSLRCTFSYDIYQNKDEVSVSPCRETLLTLQNEQFYNQSKHDCYFNKKEITIKYYKPTIGSTFIAGSVIMIITSFIICLAFIFMLISGVYSIYVITKKCFDDYERLPLINN